MLEGEGLETLLAKCRFDADLSYQGLPLVAAQSGPPPKTADFRKTKSSTRGSFERQSTMARASLQIYSCVRREIPIQSTKQDIAVSTGTNMKGG